MFGLYVGAGIAIVLSTIFLFYPKRRKLLLPNELQSLPSKDWNPAEDADLTDSDGNPITGGVPRRHRDFPDLVEPTEDSDTVCKLLKASLEQFKDRHCMGYRQELGKEAIKKAGHDGVEREWIVSKMKSNYDFFTYDVIGRRISKLGKGFRRLGIKAGDRVAIYEDTRLEWMLAAHACFTNSITVVTVYTNLGDDALLYALNEGEIKYLMMSGRNVNKLLQLIGEQGERCPSLEFILFTDTLPRDFKTAGPHKLVSLTDIERGDSQYMMPAARAEAELEPTPDTMAVIMYTSGSTGNPKGVELTHRQLAGAVGGFRSVIELLPNDIYLAYLPLAHVLELVAEISMLVLGVCVGYGRPRTLIDNPLSVQPCGDISSLRPTVMAGVPTVFDRIMKGARAKIAESHPVLKWLFNYAFNQKAAAIRTGGTSLVWDLVFGRALRRLIGGRVRRILSGGAPLSEKTDEFMRAAFSLPVSQGYGLTETCGCGTVMMENDPAYRVVGPPVPSVEIRLVDVPDMKYWSTDKVGSHGEKVLGRGEVWIRGVNVANGYYKLADTTREAFSHPGNPNGWFRTGDIGQWLENGTLQIIDRKKNLVKTSFGEYIAFEKLEAIARNSPYVNNVCVYADSLQAFAVCIVTPNEQSLRRSLKTPPGTSFEELCNSKDTEAYVLKSIATVSHAAKLKPFEVVKNVRLAPVEWTPEDGILSSAGKIKRNVVKERYGDMIDAMYAQGERRV